MIDIIIIIIIVVDIPLDEIIEAVVCTLLITGILIALLVTTPLAWTLPSWTGGGGILKLIYKRLITKDGNDNPGNIL